jgi:predicted dehydrogenase
MAMPIRIMVIGAGMIGSKHINRINAHPDFELAGLADPQTELARSLAGDAPVEADFRKLLDKTKPDAVLIASPNALHAEQGIECANRGLPFIIEKPVTESLDSAKRLHAAVQSSGVKTLVGHHRRHHPSVQKTREMIANGAIGPLVGVSGIWSMRKPDSYFEAGPWRAKKGGGVILINLIHEIDFLRYTAGEISSVQALTSNRQRAFEVEDTAALILEFASGALGTFFLSDAAPSPWTMEQGLGEAPEFPFSGQSSYRFIGGLGALEWPELRHWTQAENPPTWTAPMLARQHYATRLDPFTAQLSHFHDMIRNDVPSLQSVADGCRTLVAASAVSEAALLGKNINISHTTSQFT